MNVQERKVHEKVILLGKFYEEYGREPKVKEEYNGIKTGCFLHNIQYGHIYLYKEDKTYLEKLGIRLVSKTRREKTHEKVVLLGKFYEEFGREPKRREEYNGVKIGTFLGSIRTGNTKITKEDKEYLENFGIKYTKGAVKKQVHEKVMLLGNFYKEYGRVPKFKEEYENVRVGNFLGSIRAGNTHITKEDREYLVSLGIRI